MSLTNKTELEQLVLGMQSIADASLEPKMQALVNPFLPAYFEEAEYADLANQSLEDLYGAAYSHLMYGMKRVAGEIKAKIYNPDLEKDGWQSSHTVIEIANTDCPFLIDSVTMFLARHHLKLHLLIHPVIRVSRNPKGELLAVEQADGAFESFIHVQMDKVSSEAELATLTADLMKVLQDVHLVVDDEPAMRAKIQGAYQAMQDCPVGEAAEREEASAFLNWMADNHFLFMGYCEYDLVQEAGRDRLKVVQDSRLGILKGYVGQTYSTSFDQLPLELKALAREPELIVLNKSQSQSLVHRPAYMDFIGLKRFDKDGKVIGESRFLGLYTARAYQASPKDIPLLRQKVEFVTKRCDFLPNSYKSKTLGFVLETYPRDELIETPAEALLPVTEGIVNLQERPRVKLFVRKDRYHRYVSALVFVPRDSFSTAIRLKIENMLRVAFNGTGAEFSLQIGDGMLARLHYIIRTPAGLLPEFSVASIQSEISQLVRGWEEELHDCLVDVYGEEEGNRLSKQYVQAFSVSYKEEFSARHAVLDIQYLEALSAEHPMAIKLYRQFRKGAAVYNLKLMRVDKAIGLSASLPILESMGVKVEDEHPYRVECKDGKTFWMSDFGLALDEEALDALQSETVQANFQSLLAQVFTKTCEKDGFNRLVLKAKLNWREISLVRAWAKYLRQGGLTFSQNYIEQCVAHYPEITRGLVELFEARLDPASDKAEQADKICDKLKERLNQVSNLDEDRILNGLLSVVLAIRRTNFWQTNAQGEIKPYISFKIESKAVPFLPQPKPLFEIWVYSPRVEGVHLRGSKVARGGLRWSDRMEDFRTEVLGLVKAQMVKNSVIVPMGSKGGFVCKHLPSPKDRDAFMAEGIACYKIFISALLDLTDNIVAGKVVPPQLVKRLDPDDPYLVVAADKGTASFSDIANGVSAEYGFWLGDAFASGGSAGYDHKGMGITARGAWESVKRHFRHLGKDIQTEDFTVIGIGDMAGDVFGNGMLLSEHIQLKAAFNHLHIFLDPNPDAAASFVERQRLFTLPRSSWADYNPELISQGGGLFERSAKSIPLSAEVKAWLDVEQDSMAPDELIHAILKAEADLLYNGGIGTYVKASTETNPDAQDRANDNLRVNGKDLRVKVVGEGGNLGFTQRGRIEFALKGGLICTDAIDNSAGVDCSDHEVNIKILLGGVMANGDMTLKQRNVLLAEMTDEVAALVLRNNYLQTQILAINHLHAPQMLNVQGRMMTAMEKAGELNRALEYLPNEGVIAERRLAKQGLTSPEVAVLLAYSKITLDQALLKSDLPDDSDFISVLVNYFPHPLQTKFSTAMQNHVLRREIIANQLANYLVNRMGTTFIFRLKEELPFSEAEIVKAWWSAVHILGAEDLWRRIELLDNQVSAKTQVAMMVEIRTLTERVTRWILRHRRPIGSVYGLIDEFADKVKVLMAKLPALVASDIYPNVGKLETKLAEPNLPADLLALVSRLEYAVPFMDIIQLEQESGTPLDVVAANYYELGRSLQLDWLRDAITKLPRDNRWQSLARTALRDDLFREYKNFIQAAIQFASEDEHFVEKWLAYKAKDVEQCQFMYAELQSYGVLDLAMLSAAMRELNAHMMA